MMKTEVQINTIYERLNKYWPKYSNRKPAAKIHKESYQSLIGVMLSAQSQDKRTAVACRQLFSLADNPWDMVKLTQEEIIEEVEVLEEEVDVDVPFAIIEDVPLFPGCERVKKSQRRKCFQEKMARHISKNFRYPEIAQEMGIQGRVYVQFVIDKDGSITGIRTRGPDKNLEKEANRIIAKLPKMTPGKQRGRPVRVPFSIPITFRLQ